jgi:Fe-S oxidoreductase
MFGPILYDAFCEIKETFDPHRLLNPGKIVNAPPLTENLKFGPSYQTPDVPTAFDFSDFGGLLRAAEQCGGVGVCRKVLAGTMCPSYMATRNEADSTRGRANLLRVAISGQLSPEGFTDPALLGALDLCLECKACKSECPTGVDMARIKSEFLHQYQRRHGASRRSRVLANAERLAVWGCRLAPLSNWIARSRPARWLADRLLGLDDRRTPPAFARPTFLQWWRARPPAASGVVGLEMALFVDTFTNYYEPRQLIGAVRIAESLGAAVRVPPRVCCGRPLISKGFLDQAARQAAATVDALLGVVERGVPVVFCEPGCFSAVRDDIPQLLRGQLQDKARRIAAACVTFEQWMQHVCTGWGTDAKAQWAARFGPGPARVLLHGHCHQKSLVGMAAAVGLLQQLEGCCVQEVDSGCCGMAGSFGYEHEHYEISRAVGERMLLPSVRAREPGTVVVAPGFSCRHQIQHFTGVEAVSTIELLAASLR